MKCHLYWEHNGGDTLLYSTDFLGAYTRGASLEIALNKMPGELRSFLTWSGQQPFETITTEVSEEKNSDLNICDADSDAIFQCEREPLSREEYEFLKILALKSAADFLTIYRAIPNRNGTCLPARKTFYGAIPRTAAEMYEHTKNVTSYYFGEIGVECGNEGDIVACRKRGFDLLEKQDGFLENRTVKGSYCELWSPKKVLRRFIWHDRIHAKAMYRMARKTFEDIDIPNVFCFTHI